MLEIPNTTKYINRFCDLPKRSLCLEFQQKGPGFLSILKKNLLDNVLRFLYFTYHSNHKRRCENLSYKRDPYHMDICHQKGLPKQNSWLPKNHTYIPIFYMPYTHTSNVYVHIIIKLCNYPIQYLKL